LLLSFWPEGRESVWFRWNRRAEIVRVWAAERENDFGMDLLPI
jgi:hypothetical protein